MKIKLDRTICDGFGLCAKHAPEYFSLDDWGYATLVGEGDIPEHDRAAVTRAMLDCPVHAILKIGEHPQPEVPMHAQSETLDESRLKTEDNEAQWGFVR